jgi:cytochrome P450
VIPELPVARTGSGPRREGFALHESGPLVLVPSSFQELRAQGPVCWQEAHGGFWVAWRYREVHEILTDSERFSSRQTLEQALLSSGAGTGMSAMPLHLDPPLHGEYRRLLSRLVASASLRAGKSLVASAVDEVLGAARRDGTPFMEGFAVPMITKVLFRFVGFPADDESRFIEHAHSFLRSRELDAGVEDGGSTHADLSPPVSSDTLPTEAQLLEGSWMEEYVRGMVAGNRHRDAGGLLGLLMSTDWRAHFDSRAAEATRMLMDFLQAGLIHTPLALRNGIGHLAANRDDQVALLARPALAPRMADELLRLYPLAFPVRTVRRDTLLAGVKLHVGDVVLALIGLANRDETVFEHPDRVLLSRPNRRRHLAFGAGPHYCLGAALAHEILTVSFASRDRILRRFALPEG